jgi:hypothetical protein
MAIAPSWIAGPNLMAVDLLGDRCAAVPDQARNFLDRNPAVREQRDERAAQLARRPLGWVEAVDRGEHGAELSADVVCARLERRTPGRSLSNCRMALDVWASRCWTRARTQRAGSKRGAGSHGLGVAAGADGAPYPDIGRPMSLVQVYVFPAKRPHFFGPAGEQGHHDVGTEPGPLPRRATRPPVSEWGRSGWGRLCPPMLAFLDELPSTAPLPTLAPGWPTNEHSGFRSSMPRRRGGSWPRSSASRKPGRFLA